LGVYKMSVLKDSIEIKTTPEIAYNWFVHLDENYLVWHPDHIKAYWIGEKKAEIGARLYVEELIHGKPHALKFEMTDIELNKKLEFKILFPMSLICPKGSFIFEAKGGNCLFTATLSFRFGNLFEALAKRRVKAMKIHMKEEGENLKRLLQK